MRQRPDVHTRRRQQRLAQRRVRRVRPRARRRQRHTRLVHNLAHQRVAIRVQTTAAQTHQHIARLHTAHARQERLTLHRTHGKARDVVLVAHVHARHLSRLATDQRTLRLATPVRHALHDRRRHVHTQLRARKVVQEKQRLRTLHKQIIHRHRHEVNADRVVLAILQRHTQLRPHAVRATHQDGITQAERLEIKHAAKATERAHTPHTLRTLRHRLDPLDQRIPRINVHARRRIRHVLLRARPRQRAVRNVAAVHHAIKPDARHTRIHALQRLIKRLAHRRHRQDTPARRQQRAIVRTRRARMVHGHMLRQRRDLDRHTRRILARVATTRQHHTHRIARLDAQVHTVQAALHTRYHHIRERRRMRQQLEHSLRLGIAKAHIEFQHLGPLTRQHQPHKQHTDKRHAIAAHPLHGRPQHLAADPLLHAWRRPIGRRAVRAHATRVQTRVALANALVVLAARQRPHRVAIRKR